MRAVEGGSDRHVLVVQQGTCKLYELFAAERSGDGWEAGSARGFDLRTGALRPNGWTSADAAGLPIAPGPRASGGGERRRDRHALRVTVPRSSRAFRAPARHFASSSSDPRLPPMGLRAAAQGVVLLRGFGGQSRAILAALQALRPDRGRQRLALVHQRHGGRPLGRRRISSRSSGSRSAFEAVRP